ncbi:MAG: hypothetical protein AAGI17_05650 [Planctomycetota bacterium]
MPTWLLITLIVLGVLQLLWLGMWLTDEAPRSPSEFAAGSVRLVVRLLFWWWVW